MFDAVRAQRCLPESIFRTDIASVTRPRLVATGYVHTLRTAFSGSSYYLAEAGMRSGAFDGLVTAQSETRRDVLLQAQGLAWKALQRARGRRSGGFKFAPAFHEHVWREHLDLLSGADLLSNFQVMGGHFLSHAAKRGIRLSFYIDGTLREYFTGYGQYDCANIDPATMEAAIADEREGYAQAHRIVAMSARSRRSLIDDYGVDAARISIVPPGANIEDGVVEEEEGESTPRPAGPRDFALGFVGLYPFRKGLDRLAAALTILRGRGLRVRLKVIGNAPKEIQEMDGVDYFGVIHKSTDTARFLEVLGGVDLGCQLSRAELAGIALLEFVRLGVPILATDVGGVPEIVADGRGVLVPADIEPEALADRIEPLVRDRDAYDALAASAAASRRWASWTRVAGEIDAVLPPRG